MCGSERGRWRFLFPAWMMWVAAGWAAPLPDTLLPDDAAAWVPAPEVASTPAVATNAAGQVFDCPFPPDAERQVWDCKTRLDLRDAHGLEFLYQVDQPAAFRSITWYVRSGADWYAATLPAAGGRQRVWLPLSVFEKLGKPAGWHRVDGFRLSPWAAGRGPGRIVLQQARALRAEVAIILPDTSSPQFAERAFGERTAAWLGAQLTRLAVPHALLKDSDVPGADLRAFKLLVLPYNPQPPPTELKALRRYVERGGHLMVFYNPNPELAKLMDVRLTGYQTERVPGQWQMLAFEPSAWSGPLHVYQTTTTQLLTAQPANEQAQVLAWWADAEGRRQAEAAWIVSPRGAWMTHVLSAEDDAAKQRMLASLLGRFVPGLLERAAAEAVAAAYTHGDWFPEELARAAGTDQDLQQIQLLQAQALAELRDDQPDAAWDTAAKMAAALDQYAARKWPLPSTGMRGMWDHTGRGLYAGNWGRTARELAAAGFSDVFLFVPRGGRPDDDPIEACRRQGLQVHAWHICWNLDGQPQERIQALEKEGRLQRSATGQSKPWLCPSQPDNRQAELEILARLAATPGLAGVHLDYIRYPDEHHCYCDACKQLFAAEEKIAPEPWPDAVISGAAKDRYQHWRARQITRLVEEASARLRPDFPAVKISAAVWPDYPATLGRIGQDWGAWLKNGWVDFVCPMNYTERAGEQAAWVAAQAALPGAAGKIVAGIGVTSSQSRLVPGQALEQIHAATQAGATGFVIFDLNHTVRRELFPVLRTAGGARGPSGPTAPPAESPFTPGARDDR